MDCDRVAREDVLENYLGDRLSPDDRDAFEQHYFKCERCFDDLRLLEGIRTELRPAADASVLQTRRRVTWLAPAAGVAAVVVLASAVVLWRSREVSIAPPAAATSPSVSGIPAPNTTPAPQPPPTQRPSLQELARIEPPPFESLTLRSAPDEATARFLRGMEHYRQADYEGAVVDLRAAAELDAAAPHAGFFLGISYLMSGQEGAGIDRLRATIALGDSPYLEEAHWYLAKVFLRRRDVDAATAQLTELITLGGSWSDEARQLLTQVEKLERP